MYKTAFYKTNQFFFVLIKLSLVLGAFYFIYHKLTQNEALDLNLFIEHVFQNKRFSVINIVFLIFLSSLNWFLEITKWEVLVGSISKITFKTALTQTLGALTASLLTPNRIGDYGAKALYYTSQERTKILLLNLFGNTMQMGVTLFFGIIGLSLLANDYELPINLHYFTSIVIVCIVIMMAFYLVFKLPFFNKLKNTIQNLLVFLTHLKLKVKLATALLSLLRYLIFSFQFYVLLVHFNIDIPYFDAMILISSMYLLSSIIPSIFILDVVIKSGISVYLFALIGIPVLPVLCTITLMWIFNFVLPSLIGSYFVLNFNPIKTL